MSKNKIIPRIPNQCPPGFFRYTVVPGDTIFLLSRQLGVDDGLIIANNPHIQDPALIFPGDVLCLPIPVAFPCCALLHPAPDLPQGAQGTVLVRQLAAGQQAVSTLAVDLPAPSALGDFDAYEVLVDIVGIGAFVSLMAQAQQVPPTWADTISIPRPVLFAGAEIIVRPTNTETGASGDPVLTGDLSECAQPVNLH